MRARSLGLAFVLLSATCATERCKQGTVFLSYALTGGAEAADTIDVTLAIGGGAAQTRSVPRKKRDASIELDFGTYPSGQSLTFTLKARAGGAVLATASQTTTATPGCTSLSFKLDGGGMNDLGAPDLMVADAAAADLAVPDAATKDLAGADAAGADLAPTPDMTTPDMVIVPSVPSCTGLAVNCGASSNDSCCDSPVISGGTFYRSYDVATDNAYPNRSYPATVSDFRLDKYEVTVGRFRQFVTAGMGTQSSPPPAGVGANPYIASSGWDSSWNASLVVDTTTLTSTSGLLCHSTYQTWTASPGSNEDKPIGCITWFEAFAFCAWDGGFVPTEAEWNYAASGGSEQRAYPWSNPPPSLAIDCSYENYNIDNPSGTYCVNGIVGSANNVGTESPKGDGKWGQSDLGGNVWEWNLDWYATTYSNPCTDCSDLTVASGRVVRGGSFLNDASIQRTALRLLNSPSGRNPNIGVRCARTQ